MHDSCSLQITFHYPLKKSGLPPECRTVWIHNRPSILAQHFVWPDLAQRLLAGYKSCYWLEEHWKLGSI